MELRYERKYLVENYLLDELRERIKPFVRPDIFAREQAEYPQYTVRSIYYDNLQKDAVYTKLEGLRNRKKLRIRGYNHENRDSIVFLEIKRKIADRIAKNRAKVLYSDLRDLLETGDYAPFLLDYNQRQSDDAARFLFNMSRYHMMPVNLIVYEREPYHGLMDPGLRITFDKNIRSRINPDIGDLFGDLDFEYPWKSHFILEIKYFNPPMPIWLKSIVIDYNLKNSALSKYVEGYFCHPLNKVF